MLKAAGMAFARHGILRVDIMSTRYRLKALVLRSVERVVARAGMAMFTKAISIRGHRRLFASVEHRLEAIPLARLWGSSGASTDRRAVEAQPWLVEGPFVKTRR